VDYLEFNPIQKLSLGKNIESLSGVVMIKNLEAATPFSWGVRGVMKSPPAIPPFPKGGPRGDFINVNTHAGFDKPFESLRTSSADVEESLPFTLAPIHPRDRTPVLWRKMSQSIKNKESGDAVS
jgi:hypothetical protein